MRGRPLLGILLALSFFASGFAAASENEGTPSPSPFPLPSPSPEPTGASTPEPTSVATPPPTSATPLRASEAQTLPPSPVRGGVYDKPYLTRLGGRIAIGGYADVHGRLERENGVTEELSIVPERFNLFTFTPVSDRVRFAMELELEEAGEEVKLEAAFIDFEVHPAATLRGGIVLTPLGRFNLGHDSPANDHVDRPLVSTELLGVTLAEPGLGITGIVDVLASSRVTYEIYAVNGFQEGVLSGSPEGTRVSAGKGRFEDNNSHPSFAGRVGLSPLPRVEIGLSAHRGPYNVWTADGLRIGRRRDLAIAVADLELRWREVLIIGEWARVWLDVPGPQEGLLAQRQDGMWLEARWRFLRGRIPTLSESSFGLASRVERIDFDTDRHGDDVTRLTVGTTFRPTDETVLKLDYRRESRRDRFALETPAAAILFGFATYF